MLVTTIALAAFSRADLPEHERRDFHVYLDEFQDITTRTIASSIAQLRKYHIGFVLAHQYLSQLDPPVRDAVLGNVGTMITFRIGPADAKILGEEFYPVFSTQDLMNLPHYHVYLKLMIDGVVSRPFSAETLSPSDQSDLLSPKRQITKSP